MYEFEYNGKKILNGFKNLLDANTNRYNYVQTLLNQTYTVLSKCEKTINSIHISNIGCTIYFDYESEKIFTIQTIMDEFKKLDFKFKLVILNKDEEKRESYLDVIFPRNEVCKSNA